MIMYLAMAKIISPFSAHDDHHTQYDQDGKDEIGRAFLEGVNSQWGRQHSYGFEVEGSPSVGKKALSSPQHRKDSGISEADLSEERDDGIHGVDASESLPHRYMPISPTSPDSPELVQQPSLYSAAPHESAPGTTSGPERRKARMEDMYGAHLNQKPAELDITLSPPSPGGFLDSSDHDVTVTESSPTVSPHSSMVAMDVTVVKKMRGYGLTLRSIQVYSGDTMDYKICHITETVHENGPAWDAGLRPNQLITHIGKRNIMGFQHVQVMILLAGSTPSTSFTVIPMEQTNISKTSRKGVGHRISNRPLLRQSSSGRKKRPSHLPHFKNMDSPGVQSPSGLPARKLPTSPRRSGSFVDNLQWKLNLLERQKRLSTHLSPFTHIAPSTVTLKVTSPTASSPMQNVMENSPPESPHVPHPRHRPERYSIATSQLLLDQKPHGSMLKPRTYSFKHPSSGLGKEV